MNGINVLVSEILDFITHRYVCADGKIPAEVLTLKDEVMEIFSKAEHETDPVVIKRYERRLDEIREDILPSEQKRGQL